MITKLSLPFLYNVLANKKTVIISLACTLVSLVALMRFEIMIAGPAGPGFSALELSFSPDNFKLIASSWGESGVTLYARTIWIYFIFAISYGILLASAPVLFHERIITAGATGKKYSYWLMLIPACASLFDCSARIVFVVILKVYFNIPLFYYASAATVIKWVCIAGSLAVVFKNYSALRKSMYHTIK